MESSRFLLSLTLSVAEQATLHRDLIKNLDTLAKEHNSLSKIDAEIKSFVEERFSRIDLSKQNEPERKTIAQILEIKSLVESMRKELALIIGYIDSNQDTHQLFQEIINFKEKDISTENLVPSINKLLAHVDKSLHDASVTPERRKAIEQFKASLVKYKTSIEWERANAFASPLLNQPAAQTVQAFATGHEPAMKSLFALDQINRTGTTTVAPQRTTPINDPVATENLKKAIPYLFSYYLKSSVSLVNKGDASNPEVYLRFARSGKHLDIKFSDWQNADLSAIHLNPMQLKAYQELLLNNTTRFSPQVTSYDDEVPTEEYFAHREHKLGLTEAGRTISYPEKLAINIYTGDGYDMINKCMRGFCKNMSGEDIKEGLLHAIVIGQALPKMPDYVDPQGRQFVWRGEGTSFKKFNTLDHLLESINTNQMREPVYGFTSSSFNKPSKQFFSDNSPAAQLIKARGGKNINPYSQFHLDATMTEREVLFPRGNFIYQGSWVVKEGGINLTIFMSEFESKP